MVRRTQGLRLSIFAAIALILAAAYYLIVSQLARAGFLSLELAFFGEKAALALHGLPPRLVNVGFVYPSLSFLVQLPFGSPLIGQAGVAGILVTIVLAFINDNVRDPVLRLTAWAYVLLSPVVLYLAVEDDSTFIFAVLLAASVHYITRFLRGGYSLHLFLGSTLLGLTFFIDFRIAALLLAIVPAAALPLWRRSRAQAISVALTIAVPTLFFALAWSYVNWVFLGDPFAYVHGRGSFFRTFSISPDILAAAHDPVRTLVVTGTFLLVTLPVTLPYFVGLASLRGGRLAYTIPAVVVYAAPMLFIAFSLYGGVYRPTMTLLALFLFTLLFSLDAIKPSRLLSAAFVLSFLISFAAPQFSPNTEERGFVAALTGHGAFTANLTPYREVARAIDARGTVLVDDTTLFPLIDVAGSPSRFLLPYQYEFASAVSNPQAYARYVVVARRPDDSIYALYPGVEFGHLPQFHEIFRADEVVVFERDGAS